MEKTANQKHLHQAGEFIRKAYQNRIPKKYIFHNYSHIEDVLKHGQKIGENAGLNETELECLSMAIHFHDLGYDKGSEKHEERSAEYADEFLQSIGYPKDKTSLVVDTILATSPGKKPSTNLHKVMLDADSSHIGTKGFPEKAELLRGEWETTRDLVYSDLEWAEEQIKFLGKHEFYTQYAVENYGTRKAKNIVFCQGQLRKVKEKSVQNNLKVEELKAKLQKIKDKDTKPDRGIESMFRIMNRNHMELSAMADNKANIMISVNAIIISITVSGLAPKFDSNAFLVLPTFVFVTACLITIIFAILATRPKISGGVFTQDDIKNRKVNLMFFGNFFRMSLPDFTEGMNTMLNDKEFLYGNMIKDIYFLGLVLGKKYRLVRIAYNVFMFGLVISVIAFIVSFFMFPPDPSSVPGIPD